MFLNIEIVYSFLLLISIPSCGHNTFYPFACYGTSVPFPVWGCINKGAVNTNICVQVFVWIYAFIPRYSRLIVSL
jgi:hypothetical protein